MKNKLILLFFAFLVVLSCKGPSSGPLAKESSAKQVSSQSAHKSMNSQSPNAMSANRKIDIKVEPCKDCIRISDLLAGKKNYSGKTVRVTGKVTKFNPDIMGKNWIHIQDGTEYQGGYDLTITSDQKVSVGDTVTFEGKIVLDKDFGYGYYYSVLMEGGQTTGSI